MSPMDDLAFGIYQDSQLRDIIRRLQCQKLEYARCKFGYLNDSYSSIIST